MSMCAFNAYKGELTNYHEQSRGKISGENRWEASVAHVEIYLKCLQECANMGKVSENKVGKYKNLVLWINGNRKLQWEQRAYFRGNGGPFCRKEAQGD